MNKTLIFGSLIFLLIIASYAFIVLSPENASKLGEEDSIVENLGAASYLLAVILSFYLFFGSKSIKGRYLFKKDRNIFYLLLGLFLLICLGEEISWGQRIFNLATPEWVKARNFQDELNLHNLTVFQGTDDLGNRRHQSFVLITAPRLYNLFWLVFCLIIPIFNKFSLKTRNFLSKLSFPIVPIWIGLFFLFNSILIDLLKISKYFSSIRNVGEFGESIFAFLFLVVCISFYYTNKKTNFQTVTA